MTPTGATGTVALPIFNDIIPSQPDGGRSHIVGEPRDAAAYKSHLRPADPLAYLGPPLDAAIVAATILAAVAAGFRAAGSRWLRQTGCPPLRVGGDVAMRPDSRVVVITPAAQRKLDLAGACPKMFGVALFTVQTQVRYEIVRKIFEGGMGIVYEAEQLGARQFVKRVAIKVIRQDYAHQRQFIENFIGEAKLVADLIHTNIVQTYQLGEANGSYFIAMELIRGVNLEQFTAQLDQRHHPLPTELAVFIASRVARGLAYAHAKRDSAGRLLGIVHRDVSFKNILIAFEGDVKLSDFGIAKARGFLVDQEGEVVAGKADYMSPEQAGFLVTDKRSDLFSTGVVLAHLLLGRNLFKADTSDESRQRILALPVPDFRRLDRRLDDRLNEILQRLLARDLAQRYQTADEVLYDLEHYIYHKGYGPTNESLGRFMRELFGRDVPQPVKHPVSPDSPGRAAPVAQPAGAA